jgi:flagella basal body P-ring formation protein FlgA
MTRFAWLLLVALAAAMLALGPANAAALRNHVVVEGDTVLLGDLFDDAGPRSATPVAYAPAPGRKITLDVNWLADVARAYQVAWRPQTRFDRVVVERAGRTVGLNEVVGKLRDALAEEGLPQDALLEPMVRSGELSVAVDVPDTIDVRNATYDATSQRFTATLLIGGDHAGARRMTISGRAYPTVAVPVLRRDMNTGDVIRREDVEIARVRADRVRREIVTASADIIGKTPRYRIRAGEMVRENDTKAPILVGKNSLVTIILQTPHMMLTVQGRASEDGAKGDTIRLLNLQSKKAIEGVVVGPDLVRVDTAPRLALN